jgi:GNAT superfamily N-acetyltransferase
MSDYTIKPLGPKTWNAFATLVEKHNGIQGGCWCTWFHRGVGKDFANDPRGADANRAWKERLVREGGAHAALVCHGESAVAWCQYGPPEDLTHINFRKEYEAGLKALPKYRLTCLFVDRDHRREGVAATAVRGAVDLIATAGGGVVEAYPQDTHGEKVSATHLYNGTRSLFERAGFRYERPLGTKHCVMRKTVRRK